MTKDDRVSNIMAYEAGELGAQGTIELFADLIQSGLAWSLQGCYGRAAAALIERGLIDKEGTINQAAVDEALQGG